MSHFEPRDTDTHAQSSAANAALEHDPFIVGLKQRLPEHLRESFTEQFKVCYDAFLPHFTPCLRIGYERRVLPHSIWRLAHALELPTDFLVVAEARVHFVDVGGR